MKQKTFLNPYWFEGQNDRMRELRINKIKEFISGKDLGKILHLGEAPLFKRDLGIDFDETQGDLDIISLDGKKYNTVFMFEIVEHLFNPLHVLMNVRNVLLDGGHLFISTPKRPFFLRNKTSHFHEFQDQSLQNLLTRAGFDITKSQLFRTRPLSTGLTGIRPLLRALYENVILIEAIKIDLPIIKTVN